jgi:hypothetical protein
MRFSAQSRVDLGLPKMRRTHDAGACPWFVDPGTDTDTVTITVNY